MRFLRRSEPATDTSNIGLEKGVYPSALRITAPLFPSVATIVMVITYLVGDEIVQKTGVTSASWKATSGDFAVLIGLLAGILIWFTVAALYYPYTAAYYVSRRNYNGLREKLDYLKIRVEEADASILQRSSDTSVIEPIRRQALARAKRECEVIEKRLEDRGLGYGLGIHRTLASGTSRGRSPDQGRTLPRGSRGGYARPVTARERAYGEQRAVTRASEECH